MLSSLNYPDPTWVCAGDGNYQPVFMDAGLRHSIGDILAFPVTDGYITQGGKCDKLNVVGFARLRLIGVWKTNAALLDLCGTPPTNSSSHCIVTKWEGGGGGDGSGIIGGVDFGDREVRLVK